MRIILLALGLFVGATTASANTVKETLETASLNVAPAGVSYFVSEKFGFKIKFGGEPAKSSDNVDTEVGNIVMSSFMYEASPTEVYMVAISDYPAQYVDQSSSADLLEGGKNGALESLGINGTTSLEEISIKGHPGLRFDANNGTYWVSYSMYIVENRLYQIAALTEGDKLSAKAKDEFHGSFKLL